MNSAGSRWQQYLPAAILALATIPMGLPEARSAANGSDCGAISGVYDNLGQETDVILNRERKTTMASRVDRVPVDAKYFRFSVLPEGVGYQIDLIDKDKQVARSYPPQLGFACANQVMIKKSESSASGDGNPAKVFSTTEIGVSDHKLVISTKRQTVSTGIFTQGEVSQFHVVTRFDLIR